MSKNNKRNKDNGGPDKVPGKDKDHKVQPGPGRRPPKGSSPQERLDEARQRLDDQIEEAGI